METMSSALVVLPKDEQVREESIFLDKAREVVSEVINPHLQLDWESESQPEEASKQAFLDRRLPLYKDALTRGSLAFEKNLKVGPITLESDGISREYSKSEKGLVWKLVITEKDPFKRLEIKKKMQQKGDELEGITERWNDPLVVSRILEDGLKEQKQLFHSLETTGKKALEAVRGRNRGLTSLFIIDAKKGQTDASLHIPELYRMAGIYTSLPLRVSESNRQLIEEKKLEIVLANPDIPFLLEKVVTSVAKIESLNSLFENPQNLNQDRVSNSWIINLMIDPERISIGELKTFTSDVLWVYSQIDEINTKSTSDDDRKMNINLLINSLTTGNKMKIDNFLEDKNVNTEVGNAYISSLLVKFFSTLPGKEDLQDPRTRYKTNQLFNLVEGFKQPVLTNADIINRVKPTRKEMERKIKEQGALSETQFYEMSQDDQLTLVSHILTNKELFAKEGYSKLYFKLQQVLGIEFDISSNTFVVKNKNPKTQNINNVLIRKWSDLHIQNHAGIQDALCLLQEKSIISKAIASRWKRATILKNMKVFTSRTDKTVTSLLGGLISVDEASEQLTIDAVENAIGYSLATQREDYAESFRNHILQEQIVKRLGISRGWGYYVGARKAEGVTQTKLQADIKSLQNYFTVNEDAIIERVKTGRDMFLIELFSAESASPEDLMNGLKAKLQIKTE